MTTVIGIPIAGFFMLFVWNTLIQVRDFVTENQKSIALISQQVGINTRSLDQITSTRYSASDAARDFRLRDQKDAEQDRRIGNLEDEVGGDVGRP